jgi:hypothetical protein
MALEGVQPNSAVRASDAVEQAGKASQHRVADGFMTPPISSGSVLADTVMPVRSPTFEHTIPAWQLQGDDKQSGAPSKQQASPFGPGRSNKHPSQSATPTEVSFDSKGNLQKGTLEDCLNQEVREHGAAYIVDITRGGGSVEQITDLSGNLANWISRAKGVVVLYVDLVPDQALLNRLVNHEAPKAPDLDELVGKVILNLKDPTISRTGEEADSRTAIEGKMKAYVALLRAVKKNSRIEIRILPDKIDKTKPYIIFGSRARADTVGLPTFEPNFTNDKDLRGLVTKLNPYGNVSKIRIVFDPAVLGHQPKQPAKD